MPRLIFSVLVGAVIAYFSSMLARSAETTTSVPNPTPDQNQNVAPVCPCCGMPATPTAPGTWHCPEEKALWQENIKRAEREKIVLPYSRAPKPGTPVSPITTQELGAVKEALSTVKTSMSVEEVEARTGLPRFAARRVVDREPGVNGSFSNVLLISISYDLGDGHSLKMIYDRKPSSLKFGLAMVVLDRGLWIF